MPCNGATKGIWLGMREMTDMPELTILEDLLAHCIKDLYSAETQMLDALPRLVAASTDPALADAFATHLEETRSHVIRLEQAAELLGTSPHGLTCKGMEGPIAEEQEILRIEKGNPLKDLAVTGAPAKWNTTNSHRIARRRNSRKHAVTLKWWRCSKPQKRKRNLPRDFRWPWPRRRRRALAVDGTDGVTTLMFVFFSHRLSCLGLLLI